MIKQLTAALLVALAASGCKGPTDPSKNQVETFSNTVQPQNLDIKVLNVGNTGEFNIKLTALVPGGNVFVGVGWGQSAGVNCQPSQTNQQVTSAYVGRTVLSGQIVLKGPYCVVVFDPSGTLGTPPWPVPETYTLEVSHP